MRLRFCQTQQSGYFLYSFSFLHSPRRAVRTAISFQFPTRSRRLIGCLLQPCCGYPTNTATACPHLQQPTAQLRTVHTIHYTTDFVQILQNKATDQRNLKPLLKPWGIIPACIPPTKNCHLFCPMQMQKTTGALLSVWETGQYRQ